MIGGIIQSFALLWFPMEVSFLISISGFFLFSTFYITDSYVHLLKWEVLLLLLWWSSPFSVLLLVFPFEWLLLCLLLENGSFSFYENDKVISTSEPLLKFLGDSFSIAITCDEKVDDQCTYIDDYSITCKPEGKTAGTYEECSRYGISYSSNTISTTGLTTPTSLGDLVTIAVTSIPNYGTSALTQSFYIDIFNHAF